MRLLSIPMLPRRVASTPQGHQVQRRTCRRREQETATTATTPKEIATSQPGIVRPDTSKISPLATIRWEQSTSALRIAENSLSDGNSLSTCIPALPLLKMCRRYHFTASRRTAKHRAADASAEAVDRRAAKGPLMKLMPSSAIAGTHCIYSQGQVHVASLNPDRLPPRYSPALFVSLHQGDPATITLLGSK